MHAITRLTVAAIVVGTVMTAGAQAPEALRDAVTLGQTHDEAMFAAFNKSYTLAASGTIDHAEIITEFRRGVLMVREHAQVGDYAFGWDALGKALAPLKGMVTFIVQARVNPMNMYVREPAYDLYVATGPLSGPIASTGVKRQAIYPQGGGPGSGIYGVRLEASFPRADFTHAGLPELVVTDEKGQSIWRAHLDLTRYR